MLHESLPYPHPCMEYVTHFEAHYCSLLLIFLQVSTVSTLHSSISKIVLSVQLFNNAALLVNAKYQCRHTLAIKGNVYSPIHSGACPVHSAFTDIAGTLSNSGRAIVDTFVALMTGAGSLVAVVTSLHTR